MFGKSEYVYESFDTNSPIFAHRLKKWIQSSQEGKEDHKSKELFEMKGKVKKKKKRGSRRKKKCVYYSTSKYIK